jgi:hypothetical protein
MPRSKSAKAGFASREIEDTIIRQEPVALTFEDRTAIKAFFASAPFKKVLHNARLKQPPVFTPGLDTPLGSVIANNRLHEIRGWKMFEAALGSQVEDPKLPTPQAPDDYQRER